MRTFAISVRTRALFLYCSNMRDMHKCAKFYLVYGWMFASANKKLRTFNFLHYYFIESAPMTFLCRRWFIYKYQKFFFNLVIWHNSTFIEWGNNECLFITSLWIKYFLSVEWIYDKLRYVIWLFVVVNERISVHSYSKFLLRQELWPLFRFPSKVQ